MNIFWWIVIIYVILYVRIDLNGFQFYRKWQGGRWVYDAEEDEWKCLSGAETHCSKSDESYPDKEQKEKQ